MKEKCSATWCDRKSYAKQYCQKHYMQMRRHGRPHRTRFDPNEFVNDGNVCRISLYDKNGNLTGRALIDIEDVEKCKKYKWRRRGARYVVASLSKSKNLYLHHLIFSENCMIDHRSGNTMDNRKANLRKCTHSENLRNTGKQKRNKSGYKGVSWNTQHGKWVAQIACSKQHYYLGEFDDRISAAEAYNKAAIKLHGKFVKLNRLS